MACSLQRITLQGSCTGRLGAMVRHRWQMGAKMGLSYYHKGGTSCEADADEELHPNWSGLERRLKSRVPRERGKGVPEGRTNLKPSEEEFWHKAGVYDYSSNASVTSNPEVASREPSCARLSTVKVATENIPRVVALYKTSVAPVLQVKGFCGAQVFSNRAAGTIQSLTLWESWGDLETAVGDKRYAKAMRSLEGLIEAPPDVADTEVACSILPTTGGGDA
ncbi:unnamed protein product [Pylaiella littoralis]